MKAVILQQKKITMPVHFINPAEKYLITTNYKVWFSTLTAQSTLSRTTSSWLAGHRHYFFARNPYERLESFYRDKLFDAPANAVISPGFEWQNCLKIILNKSGQSRRPLEDQRQYLQLISFQHFIELLPDICYLDAHLVPQTFAQKNHPGSTPPNMEFDRILKVEEHDSVEFIKHELKIDTSIRRNYTKDYKIDLVWNSQMRGIANHLFRQDFTSLGYPIIQ